MGGRVGVRGYGREGLAVHTPGGLWPPHESCYLRGMRGPAPASSGASRFVERGGLKGRVGGAHTRLCIHKAVHTQGGAHTRWSMATAGVLLFNGGAGASPRIKQSKLKGRFGGAHTRRCTHKAVFSQCRRLAN